MKKLILSIVLLLMAAPLTISAASYKICLTVSYTDPSTGSSASPRTPAQKLYAELENQVLCFDPFSTDCTMEIAEYYSDTIVYSTSILEGETSCVIPELQAGIYTISFVLEDKIYWGILEIEE